LNKINYQETIKQFAQGDKDYELWLLLTWARHAVYRARETELQRYKLTPEQARILSILQYSKDVVTPALLAKLMLLKPHTVSALVNRMEKKGLVKKTRDLDRKNMIRVTLTENGMKSYKLMSKMGPIHRIMGVLGKEEGDQLYGALTKILNKASEELGLNRETLPPSE
jgi:DNA-binding MarR family transcriptional regulator